MKRHRAAGTAPGFTLVEVTVVLVLLGLLLAVVAPAFVSLAEDEDTAARLQRILTSARATTLANAAHSELVFDPLTARIWIRSLDLRPVLDTSFVLFLPAGTTLVSADPRPRIIFRADGTVWGMPIIVREGSLVTELSHDPLTGEARRIERAGAGRAP